MIYKVLAFSCKQTKAIDANYFTIFKIFSIYF